MRLIEFTHAITALVQMEQLMWRAHTSNLTMTQNDINATLQMVIQMAEKVGATITAAQLRQFRQEFTDVRRAGMIAAYLGDVRETLMDELEKLDATIS